MKHFRSPKVESDTLIDLGVFRQSPSAYFTPSPREQFKLRANRCGRLIKVQKFTRSGIRTHKKRDTGRVDHRLIYPLGLLYVPLLTFSRHHLTVGFEPTTRGVWSKLIPNCMSDWELLTRARCYTKLSYSTIAVGAFEKQMVLCIRLFRPRS